MMIDEGYIKYRGEWVADGPIDARAAETLDTWRRPLHEAGLVGEYADTGIGFGNLSIRCEGSTFYISGTQTGHLAATDGRHYSLVTDYDIDGNAVYCRGPVQASSESLTHAAIYELDASIGGIVHVHSARLWHALRGKLPTTSDTVAYGTPAMAHEFERLYRQSAFADLGLVVMGGHEEGLISIGSDLEEAAMRILGLDNEFR
ncbi:MAG: class II aldolase/adducin family protein [Woeseiaceae bacterium]|nr:class II aldolase/adducin family protein [Woeseiaceae bacterium]